MEGFKTPLPVPEFFTSSSTCYSTKKARRVPEYRRIGPPPLTAPPACGSIRFRSQKPRRISFTMPPEKRLPLIFYDQSKEELYFKQCFIIEAKIGEGCFGKVYKARSKEDNQLYAVKKAVEPFRNESDRAARLREVQKHESLPKHPNLLRFIKAWEERGCLYIQTELCKISLSELCESLHDIPESLVWKYLVDLLLAVKHLHDHDLVHMDIKPENILISEDGICKLGDFGLVCDLKKDSLVDITEGDSKYLAPEVLQERIGKHLDIFSLGITILEISCDLDLPSEGETWRLLREGHLPEGLLAGRSRDLCDVIRLMTIPDETIRPCASDILSLPAVSKIWCWRRRYVAYCQIMKTVKSCLMVMWAYFAFYGRSGRVFMRLAKLGANRNRIAGNFDHDSAAGFYDFGDEMPNGHVTQELKLESCSSDDDCSSAAICDLSAICHDEAAVNNGFPTPPVDFPDDDIQGALFSPCSPTQNGDLCKSCIKERSKAAVRQPCNSTPANDSRMRRRIIDLKSPNDLKRLRAEDQSSNYTNSPIRMSRLTTRVKNDSTSDASNLASPRPAATAAAGHVIVNAQAELSSSSNNNSSRPVLMPKNLLDAFAADSETEIEF